MNRHRLLIVAAALVVASAGLVSAHASGRLMAKPSAVAVGKVSTEYAATTRPGSGCGCADTADGWSSLFKGSES